MDTIKIPKLGKVAKSAKKPKIVKLPKMKKTAAQNIMAGARKVFLDNLR